MKLKELSNKKVFMFIQKGEGRVYVRSVQHPNHLDKIPASRLRFDMLTKKIRVSTKITMFNPNDKVTPVICFL